MSKLWEFEQTCTNVIEIRRAGTSLAHVMNEDDDIDDDDVATAQFIVDACNAKEASDEQG